MFSKGVSGRVDGKDGEGRGKILSVDRMKGEKK